MLNMLSLSCLPMSMANGNRLQSELRPEPWQAQNIGLVLESAHRNPETIWLWVRTNGTILG